MTSQQIETYRKIYNTSTNETARNVAKSKLEAAGVSLTEEKTSAQEEKVGGKKQKKSTSDKKNIIEWSDGTKWKTVTKKYAEENWEKTSIYRIYSDDESEALIESETDLTDPSAVYAVEFKPAKTKSEKTKKPEKEKKEEKPTDLVKSIKSKIKDAIDKTIYFKPGKQWLAGKIQNIISANDENSKWVIEYYPNGSKDDVNTPFVSKSISSNQMWDFLEGQEVAGYTMDKPSGTIHTTWQNIKAELDICAEERKATNTKKRIANPPVKKKPSVIFENKLESLHSYAIKRIVKKSPSREAALQKLLDKHKKELKEFFSKK